MMFGIERSGDRYGVRRIRVRSLASGPGSPHDRTTSGTFAVGDVHGDIKLIVVAWAEGIQAAIFAFKEITSPFWLNEKRLRDLKINLIGDKLAEAARAGRSS